jgi:hypothetical protein
MNERSSPGARTGTRLHTLRIIGLKRRARVLVVSLTLLERTVVRSAGAFGADRRHRDEDGGALHRPSCARANGDQDGRSTAVRSPSGRSDADVDRLARMARRLSPSITQFHAPIRRLPWSTAAVGGRRPAAARSWCCTATRSWRWRDTNSSRTRTVRVAGRGIAVTVGDAWQQGLRCQLARRICVLARGRVFGRSATILPDNRAALDRVHKLAPARRAVPDGTYRLAIAGGVADLPSGQ